MELFEFNFVVGHLGHLALGPLLLILALIFRRFPPKRINNRYGYRSRRSMKSQETWDFANKYSNSLFVRICFYIVLFQIITISIFSFEISFLASTAFEVLLSIATIPLTERKLKDKFGD